MYFPAKVSIFNQAINPNGNSSTPFKKEWDHNFWHPLIHEPAIIPALAQKKRGASFLSGIYKQSFGFFFSFRSIGEAAVQNLFTFYATPSVIQKSSKTNAKNTC